MGKPQPTDEELRTRTTKELSAQYGLTPNQIHNRRSRKGITLEPDATERAYGTRQGQFQPQGKFDEAIPDKFSWQAFNDMFDAIATVKEVEKKYDPRRHRIGWELDADKPVGILFTGDWQLGSEGVAYDLWKQEIAGVAYEYHRANPGALFAVGLGDYGSHLGILDHGGSQNRDIVKSGDQFNMLCQFFGLTAGMWLVLLQGCHDSFVSKKGAIDTVERYCELSGARHAWHGAEFDITVGQQTYVTRLRHKFRFNSSLNPANSQRRQAEMEGPADIIAHGHLHTSFVHEGVAGGQDAVMLRSGSYQIHDDFARQQVGNVKADPRQPLVILWPDKHRVWVCRDFKDGLDYLSSLRERKAA